MKSLETSEGPPPRNTTALPTSDNVVPVVNPVSQFKDQQSAVLPHKKLMIVFPVLALAQFTAYLDQTSISAAVPAIGHDLNLGSSLSWVASSYLLATTAVQLINGRLSDIFGRKQLLLSALAILAVGNLITGFSKTPGMLFAFRTLSGLGGGAM
jgi:MFS family permease